MRRLFVLAFAGSACSLFYWAVAPSTTETAVANGDTRTIHFYHTHTGESIDATFRVDGHYDPAVLKQLNHFLRDWRNNDETVMDPRLFDTLWEVYRTAGAGDTPIQIFSAYRSPETNAMLRRRSRAVAEHSQHMLGKAMDTTMPGMPMEKIREIGMKLQRGGVGYYPSSNFVHLDVGGVRSWPRMSYDQLARLFPDGKTVHIPANGVPMARYEEARAEIAARGGVEVPPAQESQGFFAWLFGGGQHDGGTVAPSQPGSLFANNTEGDEASAERGPVAAVPAAQPAPQPQPAPKSQPVPQLVATVEPVPPPAFDGPVPVPPHRPFALASAEDVLPVPPSRSNPAAANPHSSGFQLASVEDDPVPMPRPAIIQDAFSGLIGTADSVTPPEPRKAPLPDIITQGTARVLPAQTLAFSAPETPVATLSHPAAETRSPSPSPRTLGLRGVAGLRGETRNTVAKPASMAAATAAVMPGPAICGLRKAARASVSAASL